MQAFRGILCVYDGFNMIMFLRCAQEHLTCSTSLKMLEKEAQAKRIRGVFSQVVHNLDRQDSGIFLLVGLY